MIKKYLKRLIIINKQAILMEVLSIKELMQLLMKIRNTDEKWTRAFLLPILAEALDRRKTRRL